MHYQCLCKSSIRSTEAQSLNKLENNPHNLNPQAPEFVLHNPYTHGKRKNKKISPKSGVTIGQNITANSNEIFTEQNQNFQRQRQTQIKLGHLNINRLRFKMDELKNVIELHKIFKYTFSVSRKHGWMTQLGTGKSPFLTIGYFDVIAVEKSEEVCVYVHHSLSVCLLPIEHPNLEMLWLSLTLGKSLHKIGYLYRPPNAPVQFWSELDAALEGLEGSNISLLGDLNVDLLNPSDPNYLHLKSICLPLQLENILHSSTRYLKCLDPILTNSVRVQSPSSTVVHFSDHALVDAMLTAPSKCNMQGEPNLSFKRNWSADSINQFERALQRNMSSLSASGIESMWEEWRSKFTSALNEAVPLSVLKRSKKRKCPWMTPQLLHLLQKQKSYVSTCD